MAVDRKTALVLALVVSVALNLFLLGTFGARFVHRADVAPPPLSLGWMLRSAEPELRAQLVPLVEESDIQLRPLRGQMFRAQREVNRLMVEDALDEAAATAAFSRLREANMRYQEASHARIMDVFGQLDVDQRLSIMAFMESRRNPMDGPPRGRSREATNSP